MNRNQTICYKHEEIAALAGKIASSVGQDISQGEANQISEWADEIVTLAEKAKDDGVAMEKGLADKRKRIDELEAEVEDLKEQTKDLTAENESLQASQDLPV